MQRSSILLATLALLLAGCTAPSPQSITEESVSYAMIDGRKISGFLARPNDDGPHPALILIHEWWGLNDNMRSLARDFAKQGYVALAVDLYEGESTTDQTQAPALVGRVLADMDRALENLRQAVAYLRGLSQVNDEKLASVGWCFGGGWSYQMAKNDLGVRATVMYYGQFDPHDDFAHMKADILGHFGEKDANIKVDTVKEFEAALITHKGIHEIYIYPNAGHGFANPDNPAYNPEAAAKAWERTMNFLERALD